MSLDLNPTAPRPENETKPLVDRRADQPDVQRPEDEARPVRHELLLRADHVARPDHLRGHLGAHQGDRAAGRRARLRGAGADRPLAGFGGTTNFNGNCFETYTWAAGLAEATENIAIFATSHLPTVHPIVAAKAATTIDHISGGRFGLNLVMGWFSPEMDDVPRRAAPARRALRLRPGVDRPSQEAVERGGLASSTTGTFFEGENLESYPKPAPGPPPGADQRGQLAVGRRLLRAQRRHQLRLARHAGEHDGPTRRRSRTKARDEYDAPLSTMTYGLVVVRDTEKEAKEAFQSGVDMATRRGGERHEGRGLGVAGSFNEHAQAVPGALHRRAGRGYPLVGTPEQVVEELGQLNEAGMDGHDHGLR